MNRGDWPTALSSDHRVAEVTILNVYPLVASAQRGKLNPSQQSVSHFLMRIIITLILKGIHGEFQHVPQINPSSYLTPVYRGSLQRADHLFDIQMLIHPAVDHSLFQDPRI
jgi:hypothetical protein